MTKVSRSTKLAPSLLMKYSSAMLRPPATAITPSAMNSLLCMRRLTRLNSCADAAKREMQPVAPARERVEQPDLQVRRGVQRQQQRIFAGGVQIVEQQAHAHAAQRRVAQRAQQVAAGAVVVDLVVLHVERALGALHQFQPRLQRELAGRHQAETAQLGVEPGRHGDAPERGAFVGATGLDRRRVRAVGQLGAADQAHRRRQPGQPGQPAPGIRPRARCKPPRDRRRRGLLLGGGGHGPMLSERPTPGAAARRRHQRISATARWRRGRCPARRRRCQRAAPGSPSA